MQRRAAPIVSGVASFECAQPQLLSSSPLPPCPSLCTRSDDATTSVLLLERVEASWSPGLSRTVTPLLLLFSLTSFFYIIPLSIRCRRVAQLLFSTFDRANRSVPYLYIVHEYRLRRFPPNLKT